MPSLILPDINLLVYAYQDSLPKHAAAAAWLKTSLNGPASLAFCWPTLWGFVRIITNKSLWPQPADTGSAIATVHRWLTHPNAILLEPGPRHLLIYEQLLRQTGITGSKTSDAVLAAIAIEHNATVATDDRDFRKFPNLSWINPL